MKAIVLVGPTGVGKTDLSLEIVEGQFEIVSSDSVQIYRFLDIGSGKPTIKQRNLVKHHLIDIVDPNYWFNAGDFCRFALEATKTIYAQRKIPLFVGGTPFYIDSFFKGLSFIPSIDNSIKEQLILELEERGLHSLYSELVRCDKLFADKIHPNDKQRILRGLEVFRGTGRPISSFYNEKNANESEDTLYIGLYMERDLLKKRIEKRVDSMICSGFIDEVINLRKMGFGPELKSMRSIGYLEFNKYIDRKMSLEDATETMKTETKRYAKRQMTWFQRNKKIHWFSGLETNKIRNLITEWIKIVMEN
ncbi:MAG: tRNA (adenosine(37)-N6)-dimethylallyltransferase MiaA [Spirochaetota bacterium]|nr:tRNA (adenosine(37)-N6)-dimethylallyltransferase MiaA [Spirochaetota bacterium]